MPTEDIATEHTPASAPSQADLRVSDGLIQVLPIQQDKGQGGQAEQQPQAQEEADGQSSQHSTSIPDDVIQALPLQQEDSQAAGQQGSKYHQAEEQQSPQVSEIPAPDYGSRRPPVGEQASAGDQGSFAPLGTTGMDAGNSEESAVFEQSAQ